MDNKEFIREGYIAVAPDGRVLRMEYHQFAENQYMLTGDITKVTVWDSKEFVEGLVKHFNETHTNQVEFQIKKVKYIHSYKIEEII